MYMGETSPLAFGERRRMLFLAELGQPTVAPQVLQGTATLSGTLSASSLSSKTTLTAGQLKNGWPNEESNPRQRFDAAKEKLMRRNKDMMRRQNTR